MSKNFSRAIETWSHERQQGTSCSEWEDITGLIEMLEQGIGELPDFYSNQKHLLNPTMVQYTIIKMSPSMASLYMLNWIHQSCPDNLKIGWLSSVHLMQRWKRGHKWNILNILSRTGFPAGDQFSNASTDQYCTVYLCGCCCSVQRHSLEWSTTWKMMHFTSKLKSISTKQQPIPCFLLKFHFLHVGNMKYRAAWSTKTNGHVRFIQFYVADKKLW